MTDKTTADAGVREWRYSINYGPDGEENYAFVYDADGHLVGNFRTHHAIEVVNLRTRAEAAEARVRELTAPLDADEGRELVAWLRRPYNHGETDALSRKAADRIEVLGARITALTAPPSEEVVEKICWIVHQTLMDDPTYEAPVLAPIVRASMAALQGER